MRMLLSTTSLADYETFLAIKNLPSYRFRGAVAHVPDQYANLIGKSIPKADVTLCLNALHHFPGPRAVLRQVRSPVTIIEVDTSFESMICDEFDSVETATSSRKNRAIFTCRR